MDVGGKVRFVIMVEIMVSGGKKGVRVSRMVGVRLENGKRGIFICGSQKDKVEILVC